MSDAGFTARALQLLARAFDVPDDQLETWLQRETGEDIALRDEVRRLLAADARHDGPLDLPLVQQFDLAVDDADARLGQRVGPYVLRALIGRGGMGRVYRAEREEGGFTQRVAVKLLRRADDDALALRRFARERQILVRLQHPHIARFLDGGVLDDGQPWYAMELVEGEPIVRHAQARALALHERLALMMQVCDAVQHAHQNLVLHRDLKPDNILVDAQGQARLLDFGIAKLLENDTGNATAATHTELRAFTADYAAPEQLRGDAVSTATDLYALGVILFELLTGQRPFARRGPLGPDITARVAEPPSKLLARAGDARAAARVRGDLDTIVLTCLQDDPARRYVSAAALRRDLERHLAGLPIEARPDSFGYRAGKFVRRHRGTVIGGALLAIALVATTVHSLQLAASLEVERDAALDEASRQEVLREHFVAVVNRAAESDVPIEPKALVELAANQHLLGEFGDARTRLALQLALAELLIQASDYPRVLALLAEVEPQMGTASPRHRAMAWATRATAAVRVGDLELAERSLAQADAVQTDAQREGGILAARLVTVRGQVKRARGDVAGSAADAREGAQLARTATDGSAIDRGALIGSNAVALLQMGELDDALAFATQALAVWEAAKVSANGSYPTTRTVRANVLLLRGNLREALAAIEAINADDSVVEAAPARAARDLSEAKLRALLGQRDAAIAVLGRAREGMCNAVGTDSLDCLRAYAAGIDTEWYAGDLPAARASIARARAGLVAHPSPPVEAVVAQFDGVVALLEQPDDAKLQAVLDTLPRGAQNGPLPRRNATRALLMLAQRFEDGGDTARARRLAQAALETAVGIPVANTRDAGMDRALLDAWEARLAGRAVGAETIAQLEAAIGASHPWVTALRD